MKSYKNIRDYKRQKCNKNDIVTKKSAFFDTHGLI
jgi:hypothetical protein